ncbi:MAG TPA: AMP-binding protein [Solirubrobacteraceae bacterium]|nr:AMP-binding protein [Solirubrobacteraceae bacterium]
MGLGERNLARLAEQAFERRGDYEALWFEGRWHSSGELFVRSQRLAAGLSELGVAPGDRVVVTMANSPEVGIAYQALWRAGAVVTPATFLLAPQDLRHVIADAEASAVITTSEFADKVRTATSEIDPLPTLISSGNDAGFIELASLEEAEAGPVVPRADDDLAALLYTGGTTGRAKGVMLTHANLVFTGSAAHTSSYVPGINRGLTSLPLSHGYGLLVTIAGMHSPERAVGILMRWFDAKRFLELIVEHQVQVSAVVPSMLQILLSQPLEEYDLSCLRYVTSGGAPLAAEVAEQFERRVPSVSIRQGYGLTETAALVSSNPVGAEKPGSVGLPVPGTETRILDEEGAEVSRGEVGEICVRSPGVMVGYWRSSEATAEALQQGWLRTGDLGYQDEDGYLFIVDRKKDLIIRGGFNVYPRDVEDALLEHPAIEAVGVVGRPDQIHGEEVVAFVAARPGTEPTAAELVEWARGRIGGYRYPREIHLVGAIPLTAVGKVDRKALRALVSEPAASRASSADPVPASEPR